ncbi:hypothetical protein ScPMuIL_008937 [Solemya velum]
MVQEVQDFFRRKAEVEMEYSRNLDKLVRQIKIRHKQEKQRREHWPNYSVYNSWQQLLELTKKQSHDHGMVSDICNNQVVQWLGEILENSQRVFKRCRDIGTDTHEDMLKVLNELQSAMKTYHTYQSESKQAESKLKAVELQKQKLEQQLSAKSQNTSKKLKSLCRQVEKKDSRYLENKQKALKARNEYLLNIEGVNAAINKYFSDDISDLMNCMDFGYHNSVRCMMLMYQSIHTNLRYSHQTAIESIAKCLSHLDAQTDKQKFLELNNASFMLPKKFEFQPFRGDEVRQISAQKQIQDDLVKRHQSIKERLTQLGLENDETWKTLETTEKSLNEMITKKDYDVSHLFLEENHPPKSPHEAAKRRSDRLEVETYYLDKFQAYTLSCNQIARLQAKQKAIQKALGEYRMSPSGSLCRPPSLPPKPKKRRLGRTPMDQQPKLFGGSLDEYVEAVGQDIPIIMKSCIKAINLHGMHHQGIFRVSGSQVEINTFKSAFEKGQDPLAEVDASDINSVAGVLKLYFRELREPLFPLPLFDELVTCSSLDTQQRLDKIRELLTSLPRSSIIVMRYLFSFLSHLSEYSDENMMDPYNLAICFGPTLLPIPPDRDQVSYQSRVNEVIKTIISHQEEIFPCDGGEIYEKCILEDARDGNEEEEDEEDEDETNSLQSDEEESEILEATALYDFEGRTERELTFKKGEILLIYKQVSRDWWEGCFDGKEGLIPDKYICTKSVPDDKRSHSSEEDKHTSTVSLPLKHTARKTSEDLPIEKSLSQPNIAIQETEVVPSPTLTQSTTALPVLTESLEEKVTGLTSSVDSGGDTVEVEMRRQNSAPDDSTIDIDSALAEMMSELRSLENQQKSDKRMSLPIVKQKPTPKHTPDLVLDLPEDPLSSSPQEGSEPDSPTLSAAETFAKSNQGTLKKASSMPRNISNTGIHAPSNESISEVEGPQKSPAGLSTFAALRRCQGSTSTVGRLKTAAELKTEAMSTTSPPPYTSPPAYTVPQSYTGPPPVSDKPKPPLKVKPPVMKKPTRSPEVQRRFQKPDASPKVTQTSSPQSGNL